MANPARDAVSTARAHGFVLRDHVEPQVAAETIATPEGLRECLGALRQPAQCAPNKPRLLPEALYRGTLLPVERPVRRKPRVLTEFNGFDSGGR